MTKLGNDTLWNWIERVTFLLAFGNTAITIQPIVAERIALARGATTTPSGDPRFRDRHEETRKLRRALASRRSRIIVVIGRKGVGKSRFVDEVLAERPAAKHEATPRFRPDVWTLIEDVRRAAGRPSADLRPDESLIGRLEAELETLGDQSVIIVIDSAEYLLDPQGRLDDLTLDEAFEMIAHRPSHRVRIILVSSKEPVPASPHSTWYKRHCAIPVDGLPREFLHPYLDKLANEVHGRPEQLTNRLRATLYAWFGGRPRSAELFFAIIRTRPKFTVTSLMQDISASVPVHDPDAVERHLATMLARNLPAESRHVHVLLAAFGTPVGADQVTALENAERAPAEALPEDRIAEILVQLHSDHVVRRTSDNCYYVPSAEAKDALASRPAGYGQRVEDGGNMLLFRAADVLSRTRLPLHAVSRTEDLYVYRAEIAILINGGWFDVAFDVIQLISPVLRRWNAGALLFDDRVKLHSKITDDDRKMVNYNELGHLYQQRGLFPKASDAYGEALRRAAGDELIQIKLFSNLAGMYWAQNRTEHAYNYYEQARILAATRSPGVHTAALEGLARCHRRWGRYTAAVVRAEEALAIARENRSLRIIHLAVRLARWCDETGDEREALRWLTTAQEGLELFGDEALRAVYLDASADLCVYTDPGQAQKVAQMAVDRALQVQDAVTVLQARTTSAIAWLLLGDDKRAAREIALADRYRDMDGSLIVRALQGVIARRTGHRTAAHHHFRDLLGRATARLRCDQRDFAARDLVGIALCGLRMNDNEPLDEAIDEFRAARCPPVEPAPGLARLPRLLIRKLSDEDPSRLSSVIEVLDGHWQPSTS